MNTERARSKRLASIHEAAHAVAFLTNDFPVRRLSIITTARGRKPTGCRARRRERMDQGLMTTDRGMRVTAGVDIACSLAGAMAERAFLRKEARESGMPLSRDEMRSTHSCSRSDTASASATFKHVGYPIREQIRLEEETRYDVEETFDVIMALADVLLERKVMAKHEIQKVYAECVEKVNHNKPQMSL